VIGDERNANERDTRWGVHKVGKEIGRERVCGYAGVLKESYAVKGFEKGK
jgi:hypothetical protein